MSDHWKANGPPVYMSVAAYLGMSKPSESKAPSGGTDEEKYGNLEELAAMFEGMGGVIQ